VARHLRIVSPEPPRTRRPRWQSELANAITTEEELEAVVSLTEAERRGVAHAREAGLPLRITRAYAKLIDPEDPACPIRLQCVPSAQEVIQHPHDLVDPLGEVANEAAPHLVQRYPDRALLLVTDQ
jgi:lysine 2,3-aminomutase